MTSEDENLRLKWNGRLENFLNLSTISYSQSIPYYIMEPIFPSEIIQLVNIYMPKW